MTVQEEKFRTELVARIKNVGQELIDRAEDMVGENAHLLTDFDISITGLVDGGTLGVMPTIEWTTGVCSQNYLDRMLKKEK